MESSAEFSEMKLTQLEKVCDQALANQQYVLMVDKTGNAATFFNYKAKMREFQREVMAVAMGKKEKKEACEALRSMLVHSMNYGDRFAIFLDKMAPDFKSEYNFAPDHWPSDEIFDFPKWRQPECHMKIVKDDENESPQKIKGKFEMKENFQMIILASYTSDEDMQKVVASIPHGEKLAKYVIVPK